jgi:NAD(P)-dependent dehydrogenase (short-subunit alcohol dehydrogenase family)
MGKLAGKTAIVTGGGTGIGRAIALRFHEEGAQVVICGRRQEKLDEVCTVAGNDRMTGIAADVTKEEDIVRLVQATVAMTGRLDILVNNAGIMRFAPLSDTPGDIWRDMMSINAWGPWRLMVHAIPEMRRAGGGSIINLTSIAGIKALPGAGMYCASKAAMQALSQVMALETAKDNIRVNLIAPAVVEETELADPIFGHTNVQAFYDRMRPLHPLGRNGRPKDVADAALFFASEDSSWISGVILSVDGGRHLATNRPANV